MSTTLAPDYLSIPGSRFAYTGKLNRPALLVLEQVKLLLERHNMRVDYLDLFMGDPFPLGKSTKAVNARVLVKLVNFSWENQHATTADMFFSLILEDEMWRFERQDVFLGTNMVEELYVGYGVTMTNNLREAASAVTWLLSETQRILDLPRHVSFTYNECDVKITPVMHPVEWKKLRYFRVEVRKGDMRMVQHIYAHESLGFVCLDVYWTQPDKQEVHFTYNSDKVRWEVQDR